MELKQIMGGINPPPRYCINRTFMELKLANVIKKQTVTSGINRTFMELKQCAIL